MINAQYVPVAMLAQGSCSGRLAFVWRSLGRLSLSILVRGTSIKGGGAVRASTYHIVSYFKIIMNVVLIL